jgi:hypothetical protein
LGAFLTALDQGKSSATPKAAPTWDYRVTINPKLEPCASRALNATLNANDGACTLDSLRDRVLLRRFSA